MKENLKINIKDTKAIKQDIKNNKDKKKKIKKDKLKKIIDNFKKYKKKYIVAISTIMAIILIAWIIYFLNCYYIDKKYNKYEEKMNIYGFDLLYNNQSAESYEKVTNLEAVKIAIGTIYNTYDASYIGYLSSGEYEGDEWVKTAEAFGIVEKNKINKDNKDDNISYWDFIQLYLNTRNKKIDVAVSYKNNSSFKNLKSYNQQQIKYVNDLVENNLIENSKKSIYLNKDVVKGQINEIVIKYVQKYNSIAGEGETLVTKKSSLPKNSEDYPYIVYSIPNEVYEIEQLGKGDEGYLSARDLYKGRKEYYNQMEYRITNYYDKILNVNYKDINVEEFMNSLDEYLLYKYDKQIFESYVQYVKDNNIVLEGKADPLLPIVYYDGIDMRIRTKITFKILNSDTDKNILFGDLYENSNNPVTYKNKEYTLYAEVPMNRLLNVVSYMTKIRSLVNILSDRTIVKDNSI